MSAYIVAQDLLSSVPTGAALLCAAFSAVALALLLSRSLWFEGCGLAAAGCGISAHEYSLYAELFVMNHHGILATIALAAVALPRRSLVVVATAPLLYELGITSFLPSIFPIV